MVLGQALPKVLSMIRPMPMSDFIPGLPDQPVPFQSLVNPKTST